MRKRRTGDPVEPAPSRARGAPTEWAAVEAAPAGTETGPGEQPPAPAPAVLGLGIPLTETVTFGSADGMRWVAYVEGFPRESPRFPPRTMLPGRGIRFDSEAGSWFSDEVILPGNGSSTAGKIPRSARDDRAVSSELLEAH